ncbi:MAG: hypothetical protein M1814_001321 [Vezdaea aestivalis]|nr:MAG: hypothetical protein M1814_001321 [Vezdaea aestivalis]
MAAALKLFSLEGKALKLDTAADLKPHIQPLEDNKDIQQIRLAGNTLGVEACATLAELLRTQKLLQVAELADIFTSRVLAEIPPAIDSLLKAFLSLPNLHTVNLSDNAFGLNTQAPLVSFLSKHVPLKHLILNNNGLGPIAGAFVANALSELADRKKEARANGVQVPDLETVVCGRNRLENGSMAAWSKAYSLHTGVRHVKMAQNGIRPEGIALLLRKGLGECKHLETMDLQDNTFTQLGSLALSEVLEGWSKLKELGVSECLLSTRGATYVANTLASGSNKTIETLRLQYNEIDAKVLDQFINAADSSALPVLKRVELNGNKFPEDHPALDRLRTILEERMDEAGATSGDEWGLDSLSDMEEDSDDEDEDVPSDDEREAVKEKVLKEADRQENENVAQDPDKDVDDLAAKLGKTEL